MKDPEYGTMKKKVVFYDSDKRYADLKIRLSHDGLSQAKFFRGILSGYLSQDPDILNFVDKLKLSDEDKQSVKKSTTEAIEKAANIVDNAEQVVEDDTKNLSDSAIEKTSKLLSILEPNTKNYVEQIRTASSIKKMFENEGEYLENATELELTKAVVDLIKKGNAPQDIKKIILKTSDIVSRIRKLNKDGLK